MNDADLIDDRALEMEPEPEHQNGRRGWAGWFISVAFHSLLIAVMSCVYFLVKKEELDAPPTHTVTIPPPKQVEEKPKDRTFDEKIDLPIPVESDVANPMTALDLPVEKNETEDELEQAVAKGREEAIADMEAGAVGLTMAIGAGSNSKGMFGNRNGGAKRRAIGQGGGTRGSERTVDGALRWLKRHQSPNGMWDPVKYPANCSDDPKCEPGKYANVGDAETTTAMTAYAVLCFLGAGYDHQSPNPYKATVKKGLDYLISIQKADGSLGTHNYQNAIATMALAEAYGMTSDPDLKTPAQNGVNIILARQNQDLAKVAGDAKTKDPYGSFGWDYSGPNARSDSSVTGWNVMALKSALGANLSIGNGMEGSKHWLETVWKANNPDWAKLDPYKGESVFPYQYFSDQANGGANGHQGLACVGAVSAVFLGHHAGDPMLESLCNTIMNKQTPAAYPCNTYYMYYNTIAMFQVGGDRFKKWNGQVRDMLVNAQKKGNGCLDGSWDWEGTAFHGYDVGRVLSTVYCCLSLEVYYRYDQIAK